VYSLRQRFRAGYAISKPSGALTFSLIASRVNEAMRLPPALSPTNIMVLGMISIEN